MKTIAQQASTEQQDGAPSESPVDALVSPHPGVDPPHVLGGVRTVTTPRRSFVECPPRVVFGATLLGGVERSRKVVCGVGMLLYMLAKVCAWGWV